MTTPTTPITASVGEPTPWPERPTITGVMYQEVDGSWCFARIDVMDSDLSTFPPGSVLVTIPGTRDASPTAPRAEGGDFKNFHRLLCERFGYPHDERDWKRDQVSLMEHIAALIPTPPRERCEVCGGTQRVREYSDLTGYMNERVCPRCTKETPCDSGSGSSVVSRAGTNTQSDTKPASDVAASVTAASDPATVTGEGPYRVAYERANRMFYVVKPDGDRTCFGKRSIAQHAANLANHAHRTALAVREADIKELLAAFDDVNGRYIGGSPVNGRLGDEIENMAVVAMKIRARNALKGAAR
jgi:hypothetical protein